MFSFVDGQGAVQELVCELHTKLKYRGMDVKHQNRIYFHPPVESIAGDKVLIGYR